MNKFVRGLITEWRRLDLPFDGETMIVAVSGGADSTALLLALNDLRQRKKLDIRFVVAHFDHGLRGEESDADAEFVKSLAIELGFEYLSQKGNVQKTGNLEQNARIARYDFLFDAATKENAYAVLTGHTMNDQAETFLINLIRGSGPDGLSAMPAIREMLSEKEEKDARQRSPLLIRPLMQWAFRDDTEEFCRTSNIIYRSDTMNADPSFTRVRIRQELIPLLETFNPRIVRTLARTAERLKDVAEIEQNIPKDLACHTFLEIRLLKELKKSERHAVIREWLRYNRGHLRGIGMDHIEAIESLALGKKSGRIVEIPVFQRVLKKDGRLSLRQIEVEN